MGPGFLDSKRKNFNRGDKRIEKAATCLLPLSGRSAKNALQKLGDGDRADCNFMIPDNLLVESNGVPSAPFLRDQHRRVEEDIHSAQGSRCGRFPSFRISVRSLEKDSASPAGIGVRDLQNSASSRPVVFPGPSGEIRATGFPFLVRIATSPR